MKTLAEIMAQQSVFLNNWKNEMDVWADFSNEWCPDEEEQKAIRSQHENERILFAAYGTENYSGDAFVLFEKNGKLFEINGGHCSCYGLEGQWDKEEVLLAELENRLLNGELGEDNYSGNTFKKELCEFLGVEYKVNNRRYY